VTEDGSSPSTVDDDVAVSDETWWDLTLFVSGASDRSARAVTNARALCDVHLVGRSRLTVVDVHGNSGVSIGDTLLATPTLVRNLPLPVRKVVGDLSDNRKVLLALRLPSSDVPVRTIG
jgi:circadian clock protein KaiB